MKNVLVTGGAGFIGSNVMNQLHQRYHMSGIDNMMNGCEKFLNSNSVLYQSDFSDPDILNQVREGRWDVIVHLAAIPRVSYSVHFPLETHETNVNKTLLLLQAASKGKVKRFVFASSSSVYGGADMMPTPEYAPTHPESPYALQKLTIEGYARLYSKFYGLDTVSLRFFNVFGPNQLGSSAYACAIASWLTAIYQNQFLRSDGDGTQSRDLCYVDNVVSAIQLAIDCESNLNGEAINIACSRRTTNNEILTNLKTRYDNLLVKTFPTREGDVAHTQANITKAKNLLGYEPLVHFWEGLDKTIEWYDQNWETYKNVQLSV